MNDKYIASTIRTVIYGLLIVWIFHDSDKSAMQSGALTGFVIADMSTWLLWIFRDFFKNTVDNIYATAINVASLYVFNRGEVFQAPRDNDAMAVCFVVMLLTIGVKMTFFGIDLMTEDDDD